MTESTIKIVKAKSELGGNVETLAEMTNGAPTPDSNGVEQLTEQQFLIISDLAEEQSIDNVAPQYVEGLAESMIDALDLVTRDVLVAGTNVSYAGTAATRGGASGVGSGMYLSLVELRKAKRILKKNNAPGVRAQGGKYVVITHSDAMYDLEGDSNIGLAA